MLDRGIAAQFPDNFSLSPDSLKRRILEEIQKILEERLQNVLALLKGAGTTPESAMKFFAGSWNDMEESDFKDFMKENDRRRHKTLHREPHCL